MTDSFDNLDALLDSTPTPPPVKRGPGRPPKARETTSQVAPELTAENAQAAMASMAVTPLEEQVAANPVIQAEVAAYRADSTDVVEEDPEDARLRELQALLSTPEPELVAPRPKPVEELTPKQRQIRELEDLVAQRKASALTSAEPVFDTAEGENKILIHFAVDGFTAQGQTWMRGQQVEFVVGSQAYEQTKDRFGKSWLDLVDDEAAQYRKYGEVQFRRGPWRGARYDDVFAEEDKIRGYAAPVIR